MTMQKHEFKTEIKQLLDLMIHSLYSHKEVFLRELISNSSDAIDKARYESLTNPDIMEGGAEWKIKITADKDAGTLTVSDNGTGMTEEEIIKALGTIAHSGTKEFIKALQDAKLNDNPELIGQFGVGFYSSFMVADKVAVISRKAGSKDKQAVQWESSADGSFTVGTAEKETRGTDVILHLKEDAKKYLELWEIKSIVKKYSDFIEHPIVMDIEKEEESSLKKGEKIKVKEEETLNSRKALWLKGKDEISHEEHNEFYRHISHDFADPAKIIHYKAEGTSEFTSLLYIPSKAPHGILFRDYKIGPMLYVKRVKIMDNCEDIIPPYLRFAKGVVDSSDLPLNVSREMLQNNRQVEVIKKSITKKILDTLSEMKQNDYEKYISFHKEFGRVLKEGLHYDFSRRESIADLLLFESTKTEPDKYTTMQNYVEGMKEKQDEIYYISAPTREEALQSPYLENLLDKGYEVLIMTDEIDDLLMAGFEYKGKKLKSVIKGDVSFEGKDKKEREAETKEFAGLISLIKDILKDDIKDARLSSRLKDSPCCLVADEGDIDPQMERVFRAMGQEPPVSKRILEINASHPLFSAMKAAYEKSAGSAELAENIRLLYDQALILEGSKPKNPAEFAKSVAKLMAEVIEKNAVK
ncbi:MAG: molecular chaperone HtpG [Nitrospirae bacterium]|nr:molecular chaperone HtpG [Nitrospirota bacterium]MCL5977859.1 molecular chaperone HtpG [Nitrospirota bacterium]